MPDPTNSARLSSTLVYSPSIIIEPGGTYAVNFDGGSQSNGLITFTTNLQTFGSSNLPAPAEYVGPTASNFSVEVWALAPTVSDYSTMVAWGQATTASNGFEFNYGASGGNLGGAANYGANIFNWGSGGPPAAGVYHHLVTTYDGTTAKFYCDGVLVNSSTGFAGGTSFAPAAGYPIDIGAARTTSSSTAGELGAFSGTLGATSAKARMHIGKVRISDGVLTAADVSNNYAVDLPTFQLVPSTLAHAPVHRWVFNNPAGDAQSDAIVADLGTPGGQNATVVSPYVGSSFGALATFQTTSLRQGTYLHLDGGEPTNGAYADLGPGRGRKIGDCVFFQGGTAYNDAVAAAFSAVTGKEIVVPPFNGVMGAIGAALLARDKMSGNLQLTIYNLQLKGNGKDGAAGKTVRTYVSDVTRNAADTENPSRPSSIVNCQL